MTPMDKATITFGGAAALSAAWSVVIVSDMMRGESWLVLVPFAILSALITGAIVNWVAKRQVPVRITFWLGVRAMLAGLTVPVIVLCLFIALSTSRGENPLHVLTLAFIGPLYALALFGIPAGVIGGVAGALCELWFFPKSTAAPV